MPVDIIEQAFEAGRAAAKYEMAELARIKASSPDVMRVSNSFTPIQEVGYEIAPVKKRGRKPSKAATAIAGGPKEPKAPVIARGVKKTRGPRTKGVKAAIVSLISAGNWISLADMLAQTGFKEGSVRATLMDLKKTGLASQEGKMWLGMSVPAVSNSEADHAGQSA